MTINQDKNEKQIISSSKNPDEKNLFQKNGLRGNRNEWIYDTFGALAFAFIIIGFVIAINGGWNLLTIKFGYSDSTFFNHMHNAVQYIKIALGLLLSSMGILINLIRHIMKNKF